MTDSMTNQATPFRLLDPSGRSLVWVKINTDRAHTNQAFYDSDDCRIVLCPRPDGPGSPQDLSRPCHKEGMHTFFRLRDEVHEWLENVGLGRGYQFEFRYANNELTPGWHVGFMPWNSDIAALFKLAWGIHV